MMYLPYLRRRLAGAAERAALGLIDRTLALMTMTIPFKGAKVCLTVLHVIIKILLWLSAWDAASSEMMASDHDDCEPP